MKTARSGNHPFSPSSDSLTPTVHRLCHNQAFSDYAMHSSFAYRQFNSNFTYGYPTILPMSSSTSQIVSLLVTMCACPGRGKSRIWCSVRDTALRTPLSS
ncbi:hypothetical protein AVEN_86940-1 [Araneus ventricosus]|uniref:Uncharacterized protein n=1 Tax=Araneus ventricosus TaxID=182803 RepID=A0A4Y2R3F6_ARAVE|nr:hypothetical protein AVEN_86940-1 [Araneus ventricosus]